MTRGVIPPLGSWRLIGNPIRDTLLRGVIAGWMGILALALPLMVFADATTIQSWPGGLTNFQIYNYTDVLPTPTGWNAPASGQTQSTLPTTTAIKSGSYSYWTERWAGSTQFSSCAAAAQQYYTDDMNLQGNVCNNSCPCKYGTSCTATTLVCNGTVVGNLYNVAATCPVGYTLSGSSPNYTCTLSSASELAQPTPPTTTAITSGPYSYWTERWAGSTQFSSCAAAAQQYYIDDMNLQGNVCNFSCPCKYGTSCTATTLICNGTVVGNLYNVAATCPVGYTLSGSSPNYTCTLSSAPQVNKPSDGSCTIIKNTDGTLVYDNGSGVNGGDPDCTAPWQDAVAAVNDKTRGDACSCDSAMPATPSVPEPANSN